MEKREIKFRAWDKRNKKMFEVDSVEFNPGFMAIGREDAGGGQHYKIRCNEIKYLMQFTGLKDKNGVPIYEGDIVMIRTPYRSTQTHTGDNIPMGSYTEPMEAEIREEIEIVEFSNACFNFGYYDEYCPKLLSNYKIAYTLEDIKECVSYYGLKFEWQDELEYLLETYKLNTEQELLNYLGLEVISHIHQSKQEG